MSLVVRSSRKRFLIVHSRTSHTPPTKRYGNTMTSSLWRLVETLDIPALGLVGPHPRGGTLGSAENQECRYFIRSRSFMERFSNVAEQTASAVLRDNSSNRRGGPIADNDVILVDDRGEQQLFHLESFLQRSRSSHTFHAQESGCYQDPGLGRQGRRQKSEVLPALNFIFAQIGPDLCAEDHGPHNA